MQEVIQFTNRHAILSITWITLLLSVIILTFKNLLSKTKNITNIQAIQLINKSDAITIDIRPNDDFYKGHIINAINLTSLEIKKNNLKKIENYKQKFIIVVSANGLESSKPADKLVQYGFKHVFILKEGIKGWYNENLPLICNKK
nr:rhodanese-like domain-containing protein [Candidatus Arsenophonus lipoptenae]